ncbi:thioredoxin family protein [Halorussus amylolyticus]|uniref:thioredoxin family protein n=1 Tax=Halorussus amylolyticus TaxID=1126242 RepID=UPI00104432E0|nr:thioredoxin family protein [Halorussus amylolyticus]
MSDATSEPSETPDRPVGLEDSDELDAFVAAHDLALVEFYTEGCTLCQAIEPVLGNVARATAAAVGTCNPRDDTGLVEAYDVRSVPTLLLFEDGDLVDRMAAGFLGAEEIVAFVENRGRE